jgi:hypothetical protein
VVRCSHDDSTSGRLELCGRLGDEIDQATW